MVQKGRRALAVAVYSAISLAGCAKRYPVEGILLESRRSAREIVVAHRPIGDYMPAMTMTFPVSREVSLDQATPGSRVRFDLRVSKSSSIAKRLEVLTPKLEDADGTPIRVEIPANKVAIGQAVPDFSLTDQAGRAVRLGDFRGSTVAVDFIYTRCPLPDVCPRLSANFAAAAKKLTGVEFLSVTIDPQFDTPAVLSEYAKRWQADGERWRFLTGTGEQIRQTAGLFGLVYWPEEGSITHSVATAIIDRNGVLVAKIEGAKFRPDELRALLIHFGATTR